MSLSVKKYVSYTENVLSDGGRIADKPLQLFAVAAILKNPWAGRGYVEDLTPEIHAIAPELGAELTRRITAIAGSGALIEAYGKAAVVGVAGELEHASALIHTLRFGNHYRDAVGAKSFLAFTNTRGGADAPISIPLVHKHDSGKRSHYLTIQFRIGDAPAPGEIVVALGGSIGGRPHHRIGDRYKDMADLGMTAE